MKLSRLGEFGLIERVRRTTAQGRGVNLGIGDDAAWVQTRSGSCLLTADLLIEGVHFDLKWTSLYALGHKTLAVNMSDIAAMGGTPAYLLLLLEFLSPLRVRMWRNSIRAFVLWLWASLWWEEIPASRSLCLSQPAWSAMRRILRSRVAAHKSGTTSMSPAHWATRLWG